MTKNQRNMLELALINVRLDNVLQGDGRGIVYLRNEEKTQNEVFQEISNDVSSLWEMDDEALLAHAEKVANTDLDDMEHLEGYKDAPTFESYRDLLNYVREDIDGGDLVNQSTLDVLYYQIKKEQN